jgi:molecular chaperone GrpE
MTSENDTPVPEDVPEQFRDDPEILLEIAQLRAEADAQKDRALRALAEVENVRKRLERARDDEKQYAVTRFARDLLTVADNLTRALAATPPEARANESLKAVLDGVEATARELQAALGRHGVKIIQAAGARFDPNLHQAIAEVPGNGAEAGTVMNVVQPGYVIGDRLLRAAMVTVARAEGAPAHSPNGADPNSQDSDNSGGHFDVKV